MGALTSSMSISVGEFLNRLLDGRTLLDKVDP